MQVHIMLCSSCSDNIGLERMCDETLVKIAAKGDVSAFGVIASRYLKTVKQCAMRYKNLGLETDDLSQEGLIGLMSAVRTYDETCGTSFKTYARLCIDRGMISAVKAALAKRRVPSALLRPLSGELLPDADCDPAAEIIAKEDLDIFYENAGKVLSPLEYNIMNEYLAGLSYKEIAGKMNMSVKTVDNAMRRVRRKLK